MNWFHLRYWASVNLPILSVVEILKIFRFNCKKNYFIKNMISDYFFPTLKTELCWGRPPTSGLATLYDFWSSAFSVLLPPTSSFGWYEFHRRTGGIYILFCFLIPKTASYGQEPSIWATFILTISSVTAMHWCVTETIRENHGQLFWPRWSREVFKVHSCQPKDLWWHRSPLYCKQGCWESSR